MTRRLRLRADLWKAIRVYARRQREVGDLDDVEMIAKAERAINRCIGKIEDESATKGQD